MKLNFVELERFYEAYTNLTAEEKENAAELLCGECDFGDFEVFCAYTDGCIVLRYYSDEAGYHFNAPIPICENADVCAAFVKITEYCKLEAVAETVVGIEPEDLDFALRGAEKYSLGEGDDGTLAVRIITECMSQEFLPEILYEDVYLGEFSDSYAEEYEKMLKNENLNCHYGYNILDDFPEATGKDFIKNARMEFENCESMTFAVTVLENGSNAFVGEGTIYGFDGRGNASVAFRVIPQYHRRGIGKKIFIGLMKIAKEIGLKTIEADVKVENEPSLKLLSEFSSGKNLGDKVKFVFSTLDF